MSLVCLIYLRKVLLIKSKSEIAKSATSSDIQPLKSSPNWKQDFMKGIAVLRSQPWLWITILAFSFINICYAGITSILVPWLFKVHHGWEPYIYGLVVTFLRSWCDYRRTAVRHETQVESSRVYGLRRCFPKRSGATVSPLCSKRH